MRKEVIMGNDLLTVAKIVSKNGNNKNSKWYFTNTFNNSMLGRFAIVGGLLVAVSGILTMMNGIDNNSNNNKNRKR